MKSKPFGVLDTASDSVLSNANIKIKSTQPHGLLWRWSFKVALFWSVFMLLGALTVMRLLSPQLYAGVYLVNATLATTVSILIFAFLLHLPQGNWRQKLLYELLAFGVSAGLIIASMGLIVVFKLAGQEFSIYPFDGANNWAQEFSLMTSLLVGLSIFSHIAVRVFAHVAAIWNGMRRRRLVWEITHAQLRLVLAGMFTLVFVLFFLQLSAQSGIGSTSDIMNVVTLMIAIAGFIGIVAGVSMFIVVIPASLMSYFTARKITRRLDALIAGTKLVRHGNYNVQIEVDGEDEIARLQSDFNGMVAELEQARRDLEAERDAITRLLESRRRLFADISHELRTPVATLRTYLESMARVPALPQGAITNSHNEVAIMSHEVIRLQRMIDDVFTLARADVETLRFNIRAIDLTPILEQTAQIAKTQAWQARKVDVILDYQLQLPLVLGDAERVEQILHNLLRNATRHTMPGGMIIVRATLEATMVKIDVQDTGEGIDPADLPHIWERFYRSDETRATDQQGAGLGLALVKEMAEAMNGVVSVTSTRGEGACFTVRLPRVARE